MKIRLLLILLVSISSILVAQEAKTKLFVKTNSGQCYIYLNDKIEGRGNLETELAKGIYKITIKESILNWTGNEINDSIKITGKERQLEKYYNIEKQFLLNSEPQNAQVLVKDSLVGFTPLFIPLSYSNLTVLKNMYAPRNIQLNNSVPNTVDLGLPIETNSGGFVKTVWFKVLIGTAAVLGATSAYYKMQADKKYDDYLKDKSSSILSEVNRLDSISGITLGVFQVNFAALLYFLLFD